MIDGLGYDKWEINNSVAKSYYQNIIFPFLNFSFDSTEAAYVKFIILSRIISRMHKASAYNYCGSAIRYRERRKAAVPKWSP